MVQLAQYTSSDLDGVIEVFRMNVPESFHASEEADLRNYLEAHPNTYYLLRDHKPVACGGFFIDPTTKIARISWDFVSPECHGKGYGSRLLKYRLDEINALPNVHAVEVHTSQLAYKYYQKHGFQIIHTEKDYWAKGYDLVRMQLDKV
jgi:ribosomal-protein-alanine N-acetyltransferase